MKMYPSPQSKYKIYKCSNKTGSIQGYSQRILGGGGVYNFTHCPSTPTKFHKSKGIFTNIICVLVVNLEGGGRFFPCNTQLPGSMQFWPNLLILSQENSSKVELNLWHLGFNWFIQPWICRIWRLGSDRNNVYFLSNQLAPINLSLWLRAVCYYIKMSNLEIL